LNTEVQRSLCWSVNSAISRCHGLLVFTAWNWVFVVCSFVSYCLFVSASWLVSSWPLSFVIFNLYVTFYNNWTLWFAIMLIIVGCNN
jgi:hypothetical protein